MYVLQQFARVYGGLCFASAHAENTCLRRFAHEKKNFRSNKRNETDRGAMFRMRTSKLYLE